MKSALVIPNYEIIEKVAEGLSLHMLKEKFKDEQGQKLNKNARIMMKRD